MLWRGTTWDWTEGISGTKQGPLGLSYFQVANVDPKGFDCSAWLKPASAGAPIA